MRCWMDSDWKERRIEQNERIRKPWPLLFYIPSLNPLFPRAELKVACVFANHAIGGSQAITGRSLTAFPGPATGRADLVQAIVAPGDRAGNSPSRRRDCPAYPLGIRCCNGSGTPFSCGCVPNCLKKYAVFSCREANSTNRQSTR